MTDTTTQQATPIDSPVVETPTGGREQRWALPADEDRLLEIIHLLFDEYWNEIWFGIIMEGAAWEVAAPNAPERITMYDGYATVDFGRWHFHLCIGEHTASGPELGRIRRCSRAELYRSLGADGAPVSWGLRLFNGRDEQMMTAMLPKILSLLGGYDLTYGSLAGVVVMLLFFFLIGLGIVFGAHLNAALAEPPATGVDAAETGEAVEAGAA